MYCCKESWCGFMVLGRWLGVGGRGEKGRKVRKGERAYVDKSEGQD